MVRRILKQIVIVWIILVVLVALAGDVTVAAADGGRTAASFLSIGIGARAAGMGGAYTAVADGAPAIYWNPAGLANLRQSEVMLCHFAWYQDITLEHGSAAIPVWETVNFGIGVTYMNYGRIDGFDINGQPTGELSAYDLAGSVGIGARLSDRVSAGLAVKIIRQQLHNLDASAFAADVGLRYSVGKIQIAGALSNFGTDITFDSQPEKLPAAARIGMSFSSTEGALVVATEINKELYGGLFLRQGFELCFEDRYFVRSGYDYLIGEPDRSFLGHLSVGGGVRFDFGRLDYAFTPGDAVISEDLHRFSIRFHIGR